MSRPWALSSCTMSKAAPIRYRRTRTDTSLNVFAGGGVEEEVDAADLAVFALGVDRARFRPARTRARWRCMQKRSKAAAGEDAIRIEVATTAEETRRKADS